MGLTAGTVMDASAALLNDNQKQIYTYVAQIPYLNMALQELQEIFALNEVPLVDTYSVVITVPSGYDHIAHENSPNPSLPADFVEPIQVWARTYGTSTFSPVGPLSTLYPSDSIYYNQINGYVWESGQIRFGAPNQVTEVMIKYIRSLFTPIVDENSQLNIVNALSFLQFRNASLCAEFIGENKSRADSLSNDASMAIDRVVGIGTKGRQRVTTRRRPFRSAYKSRNY